jgi:hypothetical protein
MTQAVRILVVDDEVPHMKALCDTLRDQGYVADGFSSGHAALADFSAQRYDLLLTDLMMPGMDGIAFLQSALQRDPDLVGILMTGAGTISTAVEAMKAGAFDYLLKPFTLSILLPVLLRALGVRRLRVDNAALQIGMRARTAELEVANRELEAFTYSASHDLSAPLRSISFYSTILTDEHGAILSDDGRKMLSRIRANAERMSQLINDLLSLSKINRSPLQVESVDLTALAESTIATLRDQDPSRHVELHIERDLIVRGDQGLLRVLLDNVIGNAWKYTGKQPAPRIDIGSTPTEHHPRTLFVRDNGAGFDMARAEKLFAPFQRLHRLDEFPGSGIGLSIVARIVQRHGGRVWAESAVHKGSTFYMTLEAAAGP